MAFEFMLTAYDPQVQKLWGPGARSGKVVRGFPSDRATKQKKRSGPRRRRSENAIDPAPSPGMQKQFTVRGSLIVPGEEEQPVISNVTGSIMKLDPGSWKPGEKGELNVAVGDITYYRHRIKGEPAPRVNRRYLSEWWNTFMVGQGCLLHKNPVKIAGADQ